MPQREDELAPTPDFMANMMEILQAHNKSRHDVSILTCGSGRRSAMASRILAANGYTNVWHILDGYGGDDHPGYNTDIAWRAAGLPWSIERVPGTEWTVLLPE